MVILFKKKDFPLQFLSTGIVVFDHLDFWVEGWGLETQLWYLL